MRRQKPPPGGPQQGPCAFCPYHPPEPSRPAKRPTPETDAAENFLDDFSEGADIEANVAKGAGTAAGFKIATLRAAQKRRGRPYKSATNAGPWMWPAKAPKTDGGARSRQRAPNTAPRVEGATEGNVAKDEHEAAADVLTFTSAVSEERESNDAGTGGRSAPSGTFASSAWGRELSQLTKSRPPWGPGRGTKGRLP